MSKKLISALIFIFLTAFSINALSYSYQSDSTTETIALTGDPALVSPFEFYAFSESALNNNADVAFYGLRYIPDTLIYRDGIWLHDRLGNFSMLAARFTDVPGVAGLQFDDVNSYFFLNENGQVLFTSSLTGTGVDTANDFAIFFRNVDSSVSMRVREGDSAPGWPGSPPFDSFFGIQDLNNNGDSLFNAQVNLGPHPQLPEDIHRPGLWKLNSSGVVELVSKDGDSAPGTSGVFGAYNKSFINDDGLILFEGRASPGLQHGVWTRLNSNPIVKVAFEGDAAPSIAGAQFGKAGTNSTPLMNAVLNDNSELVVFSIISGAGVSDTNDHAIWFRNGSSSYQLVVREGDLAPGIGGGATIAALMGTESEPTMGRPKLNNSGQVVFSGRLQGSGVDASNDGAVWLWDNGTTLLIARTGSSVPGLLSGETIATVTLDGSKIQLNDNGEALFSASIAGPSVTEANDQALILYSQIYGTSVFIREGDTMEVAPGDSRVVSDYLLEGSPGLNSNSQILFDAGYTDITYGLFLSSPAQIVEPTCDDENENHDACDDDDEEDKQDEDENEDGHMHHHHGHHHHHYHHSEHRGENH